MAIDFTIHKEDPSHFSHAQKFYGSVGYDQPIQQNDTVFCVRQGQKILGVVRLALEFNNLVLRGMMIDPSVQRQGVGTLMLRELEKHIDADECFCLPHGWLEAFYEQIGFVKIQDRELPTHLQERLKTNREKYPQLIGMRRAQGQFLGSFDGIDYKLNKSLKPKYIAYVYDDSGINRPTSDLERIRKMYKNSNLILSAWADAQLIGLSRALTDFSYCCYLSDLAVKKSHQNSGVGKKLIELTKKLIGPQSMLLLLSAPGAMAYYPKVGFDVVENGFIIKRDSSAGARSYSWSHGAQE